MTTVVVAPRVGLGAGVGDGADGLDDRATGPTVGLGAVGATVPGAAEVTF